MNIRQTETLTIATQIGNCSSNHSKGLGILSVGSSHGQQANASLGHNEVLVGLWWKIRRQKLNETKSQPKEEAAVSKVEAGIIFLQTRNKNWPFIARFAIAPAATLCIVSSSVLLSSISKDERPPASTIFCWFVSAYLKQVHNCLFLSMKFNEFVHCWHYNTENSRYASY